MALSNPTSPGAVKRLFTVESANRALPLVRRVVEDIVRTWESVSELEQRLSVLARRSPKQRQGNLYDEEVAHSETELELRRTTLQGYVDELKAIGVELKGFDGLCDFPSMRDGHEVYLCWRLGEPSVAHWHELETGYSGRQPIEPIDSELSSQSRN